jgi:hypothetical protein
VKLRLAGWSSSNGISILGKAWPLNVLIIVSPGVSEDTDQRYVRSEPTESNDPLPFTVNGSLDSLQLNETRVVDGIASAYSVISFLKVAEISTWFRFAGSQVPEVAEYRYDTLSFSCFSYVTPVPRATSMRASGVY